MDWKDNQKRQIKELSNLLVSHAYTIFTGAGVSCSVGMPSWDSLLWTLYQKAHGRNLNKKSNEHKVFYHMNTQSSIVLARYIEILFKDSGQNWNDALYSCLYDELTKDTSDLIESICALVKKYPHTKVITYNYDDMLDENMKKNGIDIAKTTTNECATTNQIPILHVHGLIPRIKAHNIEDEQVLAENTYHDMYNNAYAWSNTAQLHALGETVCIFIGLSMTDPNLRRLLDAQKGTTCKRYVFLKKEFPNKKEKALKYMRAMNSTMQELGVEIIWYSNHDNLPQLIKQL